MRVSGSLLKVSSQRELANLLAQDSTIVRSWQVLVGMDGQMGKAARGGGKGCHEAR